MYSKQTTIINRTGLHARPASDFVLAAKRYDSKITLSRVGGDGAVNAKSISRILAEGIKAGEEVVISAEGADETLAVDSLVELIKTGFGE